MVFNIGSQQAGIISNVGRDQTVSEGQHATFLAGVAAARNEIRRIRDELDRLELPPDIGPAARAEIDSLDAELANDDVDKQAVATRLTRLTRLLKSAGALVSAGAALAAPLGALASWIGPLGQPILQLLGL